MLRDLRRADGPEYFRMLEAGFPEESRVLGNRPEEFEKIFRRVFRWDTRFILGLLRLFGRPIVRALVVEADGHVVATTLVTFPAGCAYVSNVVVEAPYRRRGYARRMLEEAERSARRAHRRFIALDVLDTNTAARTLYESLGYRSLCSRSELVREASDASRAPPGGIPGLRGFRRSDVSALVEIVRRQTPAEVEKVMPTQRDRFLESGVVNRILASEGAGWVLDRGSGPEAFVSASVSRAMEAAWVSAPVLAETVDEGLGSSLVATAATWCTARKAPRILSMVLDGNSRGRTALEATGFRHARSLWTLYRTVG